MRKQGSSASKVIGMWGVLCAGTGILASLTALCAPSKSAGSFGRRALSAGAEGVAAGSMTACISTAMLPEGFAEGGDMAGLATMVSFVLLLPVISSMLLWHEYCVVLCILV